MNSSCYILSFFVSLLFVTNGAYCRHHKGQKKQKELHHEDAQIFNVKPLNKIRHLLHDLKHRIHHASHKKENEHHHNKELHSVFHNPTGLRCRRVKFMINRNLHLKTGTSEALKRRIRAKQHAAKKLHHKFVQAKKRFQLAKKTKLFKDRDGNLATYIEDCVSSGHAVDKKFFKSGTELLIAPVYVGKKNTHQRQLSENSLKHDDIFESSENGVSDDGVLPASEDSLLQTMSDSTEMLKSNAEKEGAQFLNEQHRDKEVPSNDFAGIFQPDAMSNPIPQKAEDATEMQSYFSSTGLNNIPQFPSGVDVTRPRFTGNADEQSVAQSFREAFNELGNAEQEELEGFTNKDLHVPQTFGEAMKVENEEADYEQSYENVYGKGKSFGLSKGAAYLPEKKN